MPGQPAHRAGKPGASCGSAPTTRFRRAYDAVPRVAGITHESPHSDRPVRTRSIRLRSSHAVPARARIRDCTRERISGWTREHGARTRAPAAPCRPGDARAGTRHRLVGRPQAGARAIAHARRRVRDPKGARHGDRHAVDARDQRSRSAHRFRAQACRREARLPAPPSPDPSGLESRDANGPPPQRARLALRQRGHVRQGRRSRTAADWTRSPRARKKWWSTPGAGRRRQRTSRPSRA